MEDKTIGQLAFETYNEVMGGKTYDGKPIPEWKDISDKVKAGWEASAKKVEKQTQLAMAAFLENSAWQLRQ